MRLRIPAAPWRIGIADGLAEDYPERWAIKAWVWCDRVQWMLIMFLLLELGRWLAL